MTGKGTTEPAIEPTTDELERRILDGDTTITAADLVDAGARGRLSKLRAQRAARLAIEQAERERERAKADAITAASAELPEAFSAAREAFAAAVDAMVAAFGAADAYAAAYRRHDATLERCGVNMLASVTHARRTPPVIGSELFNRLMVVTGERVYGHEQFGQMLNQAGNGWPNNDVRHGAHPIDEAFGRAAAADGQRRAQVAAARRAATIERRQAAQR